MLQWVEGDDLLEESKQVVATGGVGEVSHSGRTGPGNDGCDENANEESTLDSVDHQQNCEDSVRQVVSCWWQDNLRYLGRTLP